MGGFLLYSIFQKLQLEDLLYTLKVTLEIIPSDLLSGQEGRQAQRGIGI